VHSLGLSTMATHAVKVHPNTANAMEQGRKVTSNRSVMSSTRSIYFDEDGVFTRDGLAAAMNSGTGKPTVAAATPPLLEEKQENYVDEVDDNMKDGAGDEDVQISEDVYNMFFLSNCGGPAFWYAFYVFALKLALYTFLAMEAVEVVEQRIEDHTDGESGRTKPMVLAAQFLMLPVAVAMQSDLIGCYYTIANVKYSPAIAQRHLYASKLKFNIASLMRGIDGMYSLFVNFIILLSATEVLSLCLNFAALQFLQQIDDIALSLAAHGYLTDRLEEVAHAVRETKLPQKRNKVSE